MSHLVKMKHRVRDLEALREASKQLGLELVEKNTYNWYGTSVGDFPLPVGFTKEDLGKCDYAIRIPDNPRAYEIGVVKAKEGTGGYELLWDFWNGGYGLQDKIGKDGGLLQQAYVTEVEIKEAYRNGYDVTRSMNEKGEVVLTCVQY